MTDGRGEDDTSSPRSINTTQDRWLTGRRGYSDASGMFEVKMRDGGMGYMSVWKEEGKRTSSAASLT